MRYEDARNALMVLRKKGAVGAKLWELWHANYQLITVRPGKPFLFIIEKLNTLLLQIAEHLPIKDALEAAALVARTKPLTETMLQALRLYARCIDAQVEILLKEVPEIIRQLNLPSRAPDAPPPAEPPHRYLDKEVRMKELMVRSCQSSCI